MNLSIFHVIEGSRCLNRIKLAVKRKICMLIFNILCRYWKNYNSNSHKKLARSIKISWKSQGLWRGKGWWFLQIALKLRVEGICMNECFVRVFWLKYLDICILFHWYLRKILQYVKSCLNSVTVLIFPKIYVFRICLYQNFMND